MRKDHTKEINAKIGQIFLNNPIQCQGNQEVPIAFAYYAGEDGEPAKESYVVFGSCGNDVIGYCGDDRILERRYYYYFDIYSKQNFFDILEQLIDILENNNFIHIPEKDGEDSFDWTTYQYYRRLIFAFDYDLTKNEGQE